MNGAVQRSIVSVREDGTLGLDTGIAPSPQTGEVAIRVAASLVSPGTEIGGWKALAEKYRAADGTAQQFVEQIGYSAAGVVVDAGEGVRSELRPGTRVVGIGAGYALHSDSVVVPHNLVVPIPDEVTFEQASYAMLLATGLHAARRGTAELGEHWCVLGLGLVGLLTARLLQIAGAFVSGIDSSQDRVDLARAWLTRGMAEASPAAFEVSRRAEETLPPATGGEGFDGAVLAFGGHAANAVNLAVRLMKCSPDGHPYGTIVAVGWPEFPYTNEIGGMNNIDLRRASRTGAGYHDEAWERGADYPPVFMRWTTQSNLRLCMELLRQGRIDVDGLTTHVLAARSIEHALPSALENPENMLGVILTYGDDA